jgi:hypothetical protein
MPLPTLPLISPETTSYRTGKTYEDINTLFKELHEGVLELGVGQCEVRCNDKPMQLQLGFELSQTKDGVLRWWDFMIRLTKVKVADPVILARMSTVEERAKIAAEFEAGWHSEFSSLRASTRPRGGGRNI